MKKTLFIIISGLLAIASIMQLEAHMSWNVSFGNRYPRRVYRPVYIQEPVCYPTYYYPHTPVHYYPVYQQPVVHYVDNREPEVALMQDGFNLMFDALSRSSHSSKKRSHRRWKR